MEDKLKRVFPLIEKVRVMGTCKILITFPAKEDMNEILKEGGTLLSEYFAEVRPWKTEEVCQTSLGGMLWHSSSRLV